MYISNCVYVNDSTSISHRKICRWALERDGEYLFKFYTRDFFLLILFVYYSFLVFSLFFPFTTSYPSRSLFLHKSLFFIFFFYTIRALRLKYFDLNSRKFYVSRIDKIAKILRKSKKKTNKLISDM